MGRNLRGPDRHMAIFNLVLIRPSHYDDEGYVIQWLRSGIPSNTLAALNALAQDCADRKILGDDIEIRVTPIDEANSKVDVKRLARMMEHDGGRGLIGLAGVQTNQFPRALDIGRRCREQGLQVCIGGFHASGILAMLPGPTPELEEALALGISLYAGESETRFDEILIDAFHGKLKPVYNYLNDLPNVDGEPPPFMPVDRVYKTLSKVTSFDAGRGCPFECSFCSIINVHGRKSRFRGPDDVEPVIRSNRDQGISRFFITDDNFARNKNWETILDRIIELREKEGIEVRLTIQVDVQCHRIPRFIDKCVKAGVKRVFIGLESINPENLAAANKNQNRITEYRTMFLAWRNAKVFTDVGYIIGFPGDTPESVMQDIGILQRELPIDRIEFTAMTPLPGSADHKAMFDSKAYMDPDLNKYDLWHITTHHPLMSDEEFKRTYLLAWKTYYSDEHIVTNLKRARQRDQYRQGARLQRPLCPGPGARGRTSPGGGAVPDPAAQGPASRNAHREPIRLLPQVQLALSAQPLEGGAGLAQVSPGTQGNRRGPGRRQLQGPGTHPGQRKGSARAGDVLPDQGGTGRRPDPPGETTCPGVTTSDNHERHRRDEHADRTF